VEGPTAAVDVFEARADAEGRPATRAALDDLDLFLDGLLRSEATVEDRGYDPLSMPRGEPKVSNFVGILADAGDLEVYGNVNPGREGWTWVRLVDDAGRPWHEQGVANATREWIGASADGSEHFYFQSRVPVDPGPSFEATAEVWFAPFSGGAPQRLLATSVRVPAR
jgi:hypothetical protein